MKGGGWEGLELECRLKFNSLFGNRAGERSGWLPPRGAVQLPVPDRRKGLEPWVLHGRGVAVRPTGQPVAGGQAPEDRQVSLYGGGAGWIHLRHGSVTSE